MANSPYSIELGVHLKTGEIRKQISAYNSNSNNAKLQLGIKLNTADLRKQIQSLNASVGTKGLLSLDTKALEASLDRVAIDIKEIRTAFGTLDTKGGMSNLLTSINQISVALDKATKQFVELNAQLNSLSGKNFGVNIGLNMGKSAAAQQGAYGDLARGTIIPQLKQQVNSIVQYYNTAYKTVASEQQALIQLVSGTKLATPAFFNDIFDRQNGLFTRMGNSANMKQQIAAYREYISLFERAAALKNPQLASSISGVSQTADQLATKAERARAGVDQLDNSLEKLKGIFGSGINAEKLSTQLDSIVVDLGEIKTALQGLAQNTSLDGLTASFNNLSTSLERLVGNAVQAQNAFNNGMNTSGASAGTQRAIQEQEQLAQTATQTANAVSQSGQKVQQTFNQMASAGNLDVLNLKEEITDADKFAAALSRLKNIQTNIGRIEVGKINTSKSVQELKVLETQLESLSAEYNETVGEINGMGGVSATQMQSFQNQITTTKLKIEQLKASITSGIKGNFGSYENQLLSLEGRIGKLATKTPELQIALGGVRRALSTLKSADGTENLVAKNQQYLSILKQVEAQVTRLEIAERNADSATALKQQKQALALKMSNWLRDNSAAAKQFGGEIQNLQVQLKNCGNMSSVRQVGRDFQKVAMQAKEAGLTALSFGDKLKKQFSQYSAYFSVYSLFMYGTMALRSMFEQVKAIDSAMTELKKVTNETDEAYSKFLSNAANRAKEIGTTIDGLVGSTADFARLGYGFEDAQGLAEVANIYAVVGDEIEGVEDATESLISTMAAFKDEASEMSNTDFAMSIIDKFNEVGNNFAISSGGIGEALKRSASSLDAANNTIDESIALITAANTVVQNPEQVGNAFKTISMRIRGAKTELEEAGLETDGMVESTAKLRSEILALSGVDIMENDNTFKSTYKIMDELAVKWKDLTDIQQASITELIAGKRQGNIVSSLMTNFQTARDALDTSMNSAGSAMIEHEKWMQSVEASINKVKAAWQGLSQSFLKSDFLKGLLGTVTKLADGFTGLIDTFGTLPTLIGLVVGGMSLFKNGGFFKVATDELTGFATGITTTFGRVAKSVNHSLSTINLKGGFRGGLGADDITALRDYNNALTHGVSRTTAWNNCMANASEAAQNAARSNEFLTGGLNGYIKSQQAAEVSTLASNKSLGSAKALMKEYHSGCKTTGMSQREFANAVKQTNPQLAAAMTGTKNVKAGMKSYTASLIGAKAATLALKVTTMALNMALTMGIGLIVGELFSAISKWMNKDKELAEQVDELTSKFKEQSKELKKLKGDYDTANESSMISKYEKLSKGVDNLGRNVSLTADEYSEYQSIVNKIAEQIPSLVTGYDSQGNALLGVKGNVEELTEAYEKLIHAQNQEILTNTNDIEKNFKKQSKDASDISLWEQFGQTIPIVNWFTDVEDLPTDTIKRLEKYLNNPEMLSDYSWSTNPSDGGWNGFDRKSLRKALKNAGVDIKWYQDELTVLKETLKNNPAKIKGIIDSHYEQFAEIVEQQKTIAKAKLSEAFDISSAISGLNYGNISEDLQAVAYQTVSSLDFDFLSNLSEKGKSLEDWTTEMLNQLSSISEADNAEIKAGFELQTKFNGGEISYGEYVEGLEDTGRLVERLNLKPELESQLKLSLGLDEEGLVAGYRQLRNRLASDEYFNIAPWEYTSFARFIDDLSAEEVSVLWKIIPELEETDYKETIEDIKNALRREMIVQGLTFDLNLEVESTGIEALNTALAESVSATGLSSESIAALKGRYSELESQGYDLTSMFEETSNGIHLNRKELGKLEKAYASQKLDEVNSDLAEMKAEYDKLGEELKTCSDEAKAGIYNDRLTLAQKISEAATLASQYEGLTSAYNDWLSAEEAGQERDMYENIIKGFETVDDEISRGWIDDAAIEFLEMLTGRTDLAGKSGKQLKEVYDSLDDTIKNTTYSIRDFFTVDEDGNSTNTGVYNFLDAIGQLEEEKFGGKDVVKRDKDGNIIGFDFEVAGGDEAIAEALGVSEELVQIMVRAADDAGFVVSLDGTYRQLADLQNEAKTAANYLKEIGKTDFEFDFNTTSVENLKTQLEEAHKILDDKKFWNKDGTFNFNADGATEAMQVVSTLQAKLDKLTEGQYGIGLTVEDEEFEEPLENLQEYGRTVQTLNQLKLNPEVNADKIEELEGNLEDIAKYFAGLDGDLKVDLGLDADDNWEEVKKKIENGEVKIPTVLDIQANMDKNIETLADLALLNSGLLSESEEEVIRKKYKVEADVDTSDADSKLGSIFGWAFGGNSNKQTKEDKRKSNISIIAQTIGIDDVDNLTSKLSNLDDKTIAAIAKVFGQTNVDLLRWAIDRLKPNEVEAIANAIGQGDVDALKEAVSNLKPTTVQIIASAFGYDDVQDLYNAIENLDPKTVEAVAYALGITDVEGLKGAIDNVKSKDVEVKATTSGESKLNILKGIIDGIKSKTVTITSWFKKITSGGSTRNDSNGFSDVNGTANVNGTTGKAFRQGSWGTKNSGTALVGELGAETLVRGSRYYTIGNNGAEFIKYQRGDIIFNHKQTEELFKNGKVTSGGGRAEALVDGTAFAQGNAFAGGSGGVGGLIKVVGNAVSKIADGVKKAVDKATKKNSDKDKPTQNNKSNSSGSGSNGGSKGSGGLDKVNGNPVGTDTSSGSSSTKDKFEDTIDWIEVILDRAERAIDKYEKQADNVYKTWAKRNKALEKEITEVGSTIDLYEQAKNQYLSEANSVGLSEDYKNKVRNGTLDIQDFKGDADEKLVEKIKNYQDLYNKYLDCVDKIEELKEKEASLYAQRFENVQSEYDNLLQAFDHTESMLNEYISQAEAKGHIVSKNYYEALISNEQKRINTLKQEQSALIKARDEAVASGEFDKYSEEWYSMCADIDDVTQAIEAGTTSIIEYNNAIRDIEWEVFDLIQERMSDITAEADFLIELMSNKKLFDDNGKMTDEGRATVGLHAQNYNTYMYQSDELGKEIANLDKQLAKDPYDKELLNRRRELIELQREAILNAEQEKNAIKDLIQEGIDLELDSLSELIDKYNEALQSQKDLYDYQKRVEEQTKNIASLQKQLASLEGDNSEESRKRIQELKLELSEAEEELAETEYEKFIQDSEQLLTSLYDQYELLLNERIDNTDYLIAQQIEAVNANASTISTTLETVADEVGTTLSTEMEAIWGEGGKAKSVVTLYGDGFQNKLTTTNTTLAGIKTSVDNMVASLNKEAQNTVTTNKTTTSAQKDPVNTKPTTEPKKETPKEEPKTIKVGGKINAGNAQIYDYAGDKSGERQYYRNDPIYTVLSEKNGYLKVRYHKLSSGVTGWFKKTDVKAYATGKKKFSNDEIAWTQENGQEFIVRPSDGAILTPVAKGDSVLTSAASRNIWNMANNPAEFIKNNLSLGSTSVPNNSTVQNSVIQNFENVTFSMPNVRNYDELIRDMQKDPNFERLVEAMSIGKLAGKSSLAKGKAIR